MNSNSEYFSREAGLCRKDPADDCEDALLASDEELLRLHLSQLSLERPFSASSVHRQDLGSPEEGPSPSLFEASDVEKQDEDGTKGGQDRARDASSGVAWHSAS